ncbi:MAG: hypothetical protein KDA60_11400, partial [Planctomycetales bacterium]|nr:hypothetical protein [Planctomycetales bacterium]
TYFSANLGEGSEATGGSLARTASFAGTAERPSAESARHISHFVGQRERTAATRRRNTAKAGEIDFFFAELSEFTHHRP